VKSVTVTVEGATALLATMSSAAQPVPGRALVVSGLGGQTARDEAQHLRRRPVEPMRIVHKAYQWLRFGQVGEQAEYRHPDQESIGRRAARKSESGAESATLRTWQSLERIQERRAKLVQRGEGKLHFGFHAACPHHATSGRV
jgi:hypothetical protein